jgi:hypothetical protein
MPEATPFTFIGSVSDNVFSLPVLLAGLPFLASEYDIKPELDAGDIDKWTTFSGHTSTSAPTQASIDASLVSAMKLFWNLSGVDFTGSNVFPDATTTANGINTLNEPEERSCTLGLDERERYGTSRFIFAGYGGNRFTILRLYYGDTFLGYGSEVRDNRLGSFDGLFYADSGFSDPSVHINLMGGSGFTPSGRIVESAVVDIDGIFFVCHTSCSDDSTNIDLDPLNLHASADNPSGTATASFDITDLNFYTYPT